MLDDGRAVAHLDIGKRVRPAPVADKQRVALRVVARPLGLGRYLDQSPVAVLADAGRNTLADDPAARIAAQMNHLRPRIGLLMVIRHGYRIELPDRAVARENTARILPRQRRSGLDLRPRQPRVLAPADSPLGDEVVDSPVAVLIARIPVLNGRVFHLGILHHDDLDDGGMQLVLVAHRSRAPLHVADIGAFVGNDQRTLELARPGRIDPEISAQLHRAVHPLGNIAKRPVRENGRVQRREKVIGIGYYAAAHQIGVLPQRLGERAENDPLLGQRIAERGLHRNGVHDRIDGHA